MKRETNRLAGETSPYLLQHQHNPVDWYPWGPEALARAKEEDKPIFLSIGYSACHWCHVMERESFEDPEIAALMNRWFVCVKVDREERPDLDEIYMAAVQRLNDGSGGWPMSVFLTPELEPFFGGTYFPPRARYGRPGFEDVLKRLHTVWIDHREEVERVGAQLVGALRAAGSAKPGEAPGADLLGDTVTEARQRFDSVHGGFAYPPGYAPKFPRCSEMVYLLRHGATAPDPGAVAMVEKTLVEMAEGGIYDQIGGGFARYAVDREWTVPHFEKMLYDNSQLASLYMEAWQATHKPLYRRVSEEILAYVTREMTSPEGGFYSATDADSEGEEGKFFVWSAEELNEVCGEDAAVARAAYGIGPHPDFEGHHVLTRRVPLERIAEKTGDSIEAVEAALVRCRAALYARRETRVHPLLDDKILSSWNGLMLSAFARAAVVFERPDYLETARRNATFLLEKMRREDGGLFRTRRGERSHLDGYLEDHAFVTQGLLDLFEADADLRWAGAALELHAFVEEHFADEERGGYFSVSDEHEALPVRTSSAQESSLPSDVGVAGMNAARLGLLTGNPELVERARATLRRHATDLANWPTACSQLLVLIDFLEGEPPEVFVAGEPGDEAVRAELGRLRRQWPPRRVFALIPSGTDEEVAGVLPPAKGKTPRDGVPAVYVCHEGVCEAPALLR
ncbi:MAG: thioredoxin domain-containing protein [Planctomycetota bacterium]|nr:thioredoxin domain-containing protein [Planctomycetota bacterium]MDP6763241.1 thioredoxin domain-containing protein [Planctomycetota bacterium]MDP6990834.1 thioredoxin domain-containing protein [Planctomycetota bacterium]